MPLRWKFLGLALISFTAAMTVSALGICEIGRSARDTAFATATDVAATLAIQIQYAHEDEPTRERTRAAAATTQKLVDFIHARDGRDLEVIDAAMVIVADSDHGEIGKRLDRMVFASVAQTLADGKPRSFTEPTTADSPARLQAVVALPAADGGPAVGALVFEYTALMKAADAAAWHASLQLLLFTAPIGVFLIGVALWASREFVTSIQRLQRAAATLAADKRARIGVYSNDELGDLARAFDAMSAHLESADHALHAEVSVRRLAQDQLQLLNDALEERVAERTTLLTQANHKLDAELTHRRHAEDDLQKMARFDSLTGLPNRSLFLNRLEHAIERSRRTGKFVGLMFADIDRFKSVNDSFGHAAGDRVLQEVAQRLRSLLRQTDIVSRIGGDEFTVILEDVEDKETLADVARKVVEGFARPLEIDGREAFLTLSIGVAVAPADSLDVGELMRKADFAMYHAKAEGRNGFQFHSELLGAGVRARLSIEHELRHALERDEFSLHYQVRVSAETNRPVGMEALLRWNNPELGSVAPGDFIPVAEETGFILELGAWVFRQACAQHTAWRLAGLTPGVMGVNVSARQFRQAGFVAELVRISEETGMAPCNIELELTESMLMSDIGRASALMTELRALGFGIAIDDFGTGYSSLSHLKSLPATKIKIDRAFVKNIDSNAEDAAIAAAIVTLATTLGMKITAEGVETVGQLDSLDQLACTEYQGFLFSEPLPAGSMGEVLRRGLRTKALPSREERVLTMPGALS